MRSIARAAAALTVCAMLAACSAGASLPSGTAASFRNVHRPFLWHGALGKFKVRIVVPSRRRREKIAALAARAAAKRPVSALKPRYLPSGATTICFSLISTLGGYPTGDDGKCDGDSKFDFAVSTSDANACAAVSDPTTPSYTCAVSAAAPAGQDDYTIVASDASLVLSESNVAISVAPLSIVSGTFSLEPLVASLRWVPGTASADDPLVPISQPFSNGTGTPVWDGTGYSCPNSSYGGCYDPVLNNAGTPLADTATLQALDEGGNVIIPTAQGQTASGAPYVPIYLTGGDDLQSGNEAEVSIVCFDSHVELVPPSPPDGLPPLAYALISARGTSANPDVANGVTPTGGPAGPGNINAISGVTGGAPTFNSPVAAADGSATDGYGTGSATAFTAVNGAPIGDAVYGNNIAYVNYDGGGGTGYTGTRYCTAYLADAATQTLYGSFQGNLHVGPALGGSGVTVNGRRRRPARAAQAAIDWGSNGRKRR